MMAPPRTSARLGFFMRQTARRLDIREHPLTDGPDHRDNNRRAREPQSPHVYRRQRPVDKLLVHELRCDGQAIRELDLTRGIFSCSYP